MNFWILVSIPFAALRGTRMRSVLPLLLCVLFVGASLSGCGKKAPLSPPLSQGGSESDYYKDSQKSASQQEASGSDDNELFPTLNKTITRSDEKKFPKPQIPKRDFPLDPLLN